MQSKVKLTFQKHFENTRKNGGAARSAPPLNPPMTPETNNGRHTQTLIPRVSFPVSSLFLIQTTSQTLGSRIQINKERSITAPDKVWGNPTQKVMRMKFYDEKKSQLN